MPRTITFDNKQIIEPGATARTIGGVAESNIAADTGTVLIIDTGRGAGFGGGSGFSGENSQGVSSIYEFADYAAFRKWNGGGEMNQVVFKLFNPSETYAGAQKLLYVQAKESTSPSATLTLANGTIVMKTLAEGVGANGVLDSGELISGFAAKLVSGVTNTSKVKLQIYRGAYEGLDADGELVGNGTETSATLVAESREVSSFSELNDWINNNPTGNGYLASIVATGTGDITTADVTSNTTFTVFDGGTESYTSTVYDDLVRSLDEIDYNFAIVAINGGVNAVGVENTKLFTALTTTSLDTKFLIIAGGNDSTDYDQLNDSSFAAAAYYDHEQVQVFHGGIQKVRREGGYKTYDSLHGAALFAGLVAGLEPQVPATFKSIDVDRPTFELSKTQREAGLKAGVVHMRDVRTRGWSINQDVNTKQDNDYQVQSDGTSPEGPIARIKAALNRIVRQETELQFVGKSYSEANPATVKNFVEKILLDNTASSSQQGLIIRAFGVSVTFSNGDLYVEYSFVPNGPVNRVFITGTILDVSFE